MWNILFSNKAQRAGCTAVEDPSFLRLIANPRGNMLYNNNMSSSTGKGSALFSQANLKHLINAHKPHVEIRPSFLPARKRQSTRNPHPQIRLFSKRMSPVRCTSCCHRQTNTSENGSLVVWSEWTNGVSPRHNVSWLANGIVVIWKQISRSLPPLNFSSKHMILHGSPSLEWKASREVILTLDIEAIFDCFLFMVFLRVRI